MTVIILACDKLTGHVYPITKCNKTFSKGTELTEFKMICPKILGEMIVGFTILVHDMHSVPIQLYQLNLSKLFQTLLELCSAHI